MNSADYRVAPMSWNDVDQTADRIRETLRLTDTCFFPIVDVIEKVLPQLTGEDFAFEVGSQEEMGSAEGLTCPEGKFIRLREDVYNDVCADGARARFTLAHEFGHFLLHTGQNRPLERAQPNERLRPFESAEKQADRFAATLLMPACLIWPMDTISDLVAKFGVSHSAAEVRLDKLLKEGRK